MKRRYHTEDEETRTVPTSFKIKPSHFEILMAMSKEEDRSKSAIVERALVNLFKKEKKL